MLYRLKQYTVEPSRAEAFNAFFRTYLFAVQQRHGARLVGRWQTEQGDRIVALWVYDSWDRYKAIQQDVRTDPDSIRAQELRRSELDPLFIESEQHFMVSTVPLEWTELSHLEASD